MSLIRNVLAAGVALAAASPILAQQPKPITFEDAIAIALKQNIAVRQAQNAAQLGDATVKQQKMQLLPDLRLNVNGSNNVGRNFSQSDGAIVNQQTQSLNTGLSTSLTLFDGGKTTSSIRSAQANQQASAQDLTRARQTAVFTVATDYVALANQREQLRVQQENLAAQQAQQDLIQKFVDAGSRPVADLYQQQATVAAAKLSIAQTTRAVELAKVDVIQALQLDPAGTYDFGFTDQLDQRRGGSIGLGISIPLFDRGATGLAEQRAQLAADNERLALAATRQTIALEVRRAYLDLSSAREQLAAAEAQQAAAQQAVEVVEKRYQAGAATLVEVTQARASQVQAASAVISARYGLLLQRTALSYYTGDLDPSTAQF